MCGIAGIAGGREVPERARLEAMLAALTHRGPDSQGLQAGDRWAIGARRLAVIDLATGDQPVGNESGTVWAVLNGEIYNYRELREGLLERGHRLRTAGDTEVLVHLWEERGPALVSELRGMFALALVDQRQGTLMLARDRVGKKPLYWSRHGGRLIFASELKALRHALPVSPAIDRGAVDAYLQWGFVPEGQCILSGVEKLPPAHWLTVDLLTGEMRQRRYWRLELRPDQEIGIEQAAQELTGLVGDAVSLRMRADVPVAIFLSGGIDSGLVAALAGRAGHRPRTITMCFPGQDAEAALARASAGRAGLENEQIDVDPQRGLELLPRLAEVFDEPIADSSVIPTVLMAQAVRPQAKVVLNGDGGDEALGGYRRFLAARLEGVPGHRWWGPVLGPVLARLGGAQAGAGERMAAGLGGGADSYRAWGPVKLSAGEVKALTGAAPGPTPALEATLDRSHHCDPVNRLRLIELEFFLPGDLLVKMDRATMAASLEARSPLLDHVFLERAAAFPPDILLKGWRTKAVAREAARELLPAAVRFAGKRGFEVPLTRWLSREWEGAVRETLSDPAAMLSQRLGLDPAALSAWMGWRRRRDPQRAARAVFTLLTLEHWLRRWA